MEIGTRHQDVSRGRNTNWIQNSENCSQTSTKFGRFRRVLSDQLQSSLSNLMTVMCFRTNVCARINKPITRRSLFSVRHPEKVVRSQDGQILHLKFTGQCIFFVFLLFFQFFFKKNRVDVFSNKKERGRNSGVRFDFAKPRSLFFFRMIRAILKSEFLYPCIKDNSLKLLPVAFIALWKAHLYLQQWFW